VIVNEYHGSTIYWNLNGAGYAWQYPAFTAANTDVTLTDLTVTAVNFPAIASVMAQVVEICDNRIFMQDTAGLWPAIYVSGSETSIERNWIGLEDVADATNYASEAVQTDLSASFTAPPATPTGNGGIQVGGFSNTIAIVENQIEGGAFNAISLGGYVLTNDGVQASGLQGLFPAAPATAGAQTTLALPPVTGNSQLAADGPLQNIRIEKNRISNCGLCGIGPVGYFASPQMPETVSIANLSILGNTLSGTMQAAPAALPDSLAGTVGYGAISLPDLQNTIIRDNVITDFGSEPGAQVCGIFVLNAEQLEISRNQIVETRDWVALNSAAPPANGGQQAGIAIAMVSPPALNQVTSPTWAGSSTQGVTTAGSPPIYQPGMPALRIEQNVVRIPLGYSLTVLGYGPFSITGNQFTTGGTVPWGGGAPPIALNIFVLNLGLPVEFDNVTSFSSAWTMANGNYGLPSLSSVDASIATSTCGTILFAHNMCQVETRGSSAGAPFSSFIATLDHLNYSNNLSWVDGAGVTLPPIVKDQRGASLVALSDALLFGVSLQVMANRFQEPGGSVVASGVTAGVLNVTSNNISTVCLLPLGARLAAANNISYLPAEVCKAASVDLLLVILYGTLASGATFPVQLAAAAAAPATPAPVAPAPPGDVSVSVEAEAEKAPMPAPAEAEIPPVGIAPIPIAPIPIAPIPTPPIPTAPIPTAPTPTAPTPTAPTPTAPTPTAPTPTAPAPTAANTLNATPTAMTQADSTSANGLQLLSQTHQARLAQVTRIAATITKQSGAGSVQATAAQAAVTSSQATIARVAILKQRVTSQAPTVPATGWGIYGTVYNSSNAPVQGYSVYFVDSTNTYQNTCGIAYTQADGSYQFVYAGPAAGQAAPTATLYLQVANGSGDPIYTSATAFTPTTGAATYQTITLPVGEKPLGRLPIVLRPVILPVDTNIAPATDTPAENKG
jgi:hypothetical protein